METENQLGNRNVHERLRAGRTQGQLTGASPKRSQALRKTQRSNALINPDLAPGNHLNVVYVYDATKGGGVFAKLAQAAFFSLKTVIWGATALRIEALRPRIPYSPLCTTRRDILNT